MSAGDAAAGRPHSAGVPCVELEGGVFFTSGPATRKSRHLAANPACALSVRLPGVDLVLEGEARRVAEPGVLARVAALYREHGWPAEPDGDVLPGTVQRPERRPAAVAPLPVRRAHGRRRRAHRPARRDALARPVEVRGLTRRRPWPEKATLGSG